MRTAGKSEMMAAAFMQAAFNLANSLGAFAGGLPISFGYSYNYPALVGAVLAFGGLILCYFYYHRYNRIGGRNLSLKG